MTYPWQITGAVVVEEDATTCDDLGRPIVQRRPLAGIPVQIAARRSDREGFTSWGHAWTDDEGHFRLREERPDGEYRFRVSVAFIGERLVVGRDMPIGWFAARELDVDVNGPFVHVGATTFRDGLTGALGESDNVRRAITWYAARTAMEYLSGLGAGLGFTQPIGIRYPIETANGRPHTDPVTRTATIPRRDWSVESVLQQVVRLWLMQCGGARGVWPPDEGARRNLLTATDEEFAVFATNALVERLWGRTIAARRRAG